MLINDTIAAVSTPYGRGGIAVIRISGPEALKVAGRVFRTSAGSAETLEAGRAVYGEILRGGKVIDTGILTVFRAPHSYTGEDTAEISCHGGILITQEVLAAVYDGGAGPAGPGEFTKRAYISGKLGLSEAEAVIDLIDAESPEQLKLASAQSRGVLSGRINEISGGIKSVLASIYAYIDYPDEDMREMSESEMESELARISGELDGLLSTYRCGRAVRQGIATVLAGKPNTGKSAILNRILGEDRAIVTDVAGTTRDTIEEKAFAGRVMLRLCDTAGIRQTGDPVERLGVERSRKKLSGAELILAVFDISEPPDDEDAEAAKFVCSAAAESGARIIVLLNKSDIASESKFNTDCDITDSSGGMHNTDSADSGDASALCADAFSSGSGSGKYNDYTDSFLSLFEGISIDSFRVSAKTGDGIDNMLAFIESLYISGEIRYDDTAVLSNARQNSAVLRAKESVDAALAALRSGLTADMAGLDAEQALSSLGELDGRSVAEEITSEIFSRFCVGK